MSLSEVQANPEVQAGTWVIDASHSVVAFSVRHLMVSKVRGRFTQFEGTVVIDPDPTKSSVNATIQTASVSTGDEKRDGHLQSADFLDVENSPTIDFHSTGLVAKAGNYLLGGEITIAGVTRPVTLNLDLNGTTADPWGGTRVGFEATTTISRSDFGIDFSIPMDGGGIVVGDKITITLDIEAVLQK